MFLLLTVTFIVLGIGNAGGTTGIIKLGGWIGLATALAAWYASFAEVTNSTFGRTVLPVRPLGETEAETHGEELTWRRKADARAAARGAARAGDVRRRRRSSPSRRSSPTPGSTSEADEDPEGFWAEQAEALRLGHEVGPGARLVQPAVREVVRRRQAQRLLQLRRPPRRGRQRRPRRLPLARRGGRGARRHLRRPAPRRPEASPTRSRTSASTRATSSGSTCR